VFLILDKVLSFYLSKYPAKLHFESGIAPIRNTRKRTGGTTLLARASIGRKVKNVGVMTNGEAFVCAVRHDVYSTLLYTSKCISLSAHTSFYSHSIQRTVIDTDEQIHSDSQRVDTRSDNRKRMRHIRPKVADPLSAQLASIHFEETSIEL
jgi:hypothetical protein